MSINQEAIIEVANQLSIPLKNVVQALKLLVEENCSIPFVARYRKDVTGALDEVQLEGVKTGYEEIGQRESRREFILNAIEKLEKLTPELKKSILEAMTLQQLEDLYAPYKSQKKTKATKAIEAGLEELAKLILTGEKSQAELQDIAGSKFLNPKAGIETGGLAISGAMDIIIESIAHHPEIKNDLRESYWKAGNLKSAKRKGAEEIEGFDKFRDYFEFEQPLASLKESKATHRFLAIRRGMALKVLKFEITFNPEVALMTIQSIFLKDFSGNHREYLDQCMLKAYQQYIHKSLDLEIKTELKKISDEAAIEVFGRGLKDLLLGPYLGAKSVLGIDPGVRTGCKLVVIDQTGKLEFDSVIYPHPPQKAIEDSAKLISGIIREFKVEFIAIGNGTFGRETLDFLRESVSEVKEGKVQATLINEDGASIYSASDIARSEFPDKDLTVRGAVSIARRFQDPLAELVKIDPKSIGVGQYQHDVNQAKLKKSLGQVVENCVNFVGVDINTASIPLLSYISGIGPTAAANIVKARQEWGGIKSREELLKIPRFTAKIFEQSAGFLRVYDGENPLDGTFIHPEQYSIIESWCQEHGMDLNQLVKDKDAQAKFAKDQNLRDKLGSFSHEDISKSLSAPRQDPRDQFTPVQYRKDIKEMKDLTPGQWYPGVVSNITQFGAFVDLGIKTKGLIHVSQMADRFVSNPQDVLKIGEVVKAKVIDIDHDRKRISLSLKTGEKANLNPEAPKSGTRPNKEAPPQKLRNNAFAALKNFSVKN